MIVFTRGVIAVGGNSGVVWLIVWRFVLLSTGNVLRGGLEGRCELVLIFSLTVKYISSEITYLGCRSKDTLMQILNQFCRSFLMLN